MGRGILEEVKHSMRRTVFRNLSISAKIVWLDL